MSKNSSTQTEQRQFWQMAVEAWQAGGLSVRRFCKQEGLSEPSFYSWRKRLATPAEAQPDADVECRPEQFIQVSLPTASVSGVELLLSSGHLLKIPIGVDRKTLTAVLSAMGEAGLC